ncbi:hypothetical protein LC085_01880 [Bacillus tianshenii]|uniref:hypothetical protein n=1 Tax=Sutcliffiella tianshenii TaxID=1463404 RepID=UPI001CD20BDC|nr:hypothetical protein [Bacillus tianshenii]MCA1318644.1 hypothetical protein [Bacillus tianshenii]
MFLFYLCSCIFAGVLILLVHKKELPSLNYLFLRGGFIGLVCFLFTNAYAAHYNYFIDFNLLHLAGLVAVSVFVSYFVSRIKMWT